MTTLGIRRGRQARLAALALLVSAALVGSVGEATARPAPAAAPVDLVQPTQIAFDARGNTYVYDLQRYVVVRITPEGTTSVVAGNGTSGPLSEGPATATPLGWIEDMAVAADGTLYLADHTNFAVVKVTPGGTLSVLEGATRGTPSGVGVDAAGNVYVADCGSNAIRKVSPGGSVRTLLDESSSVPGWRGTFHPETIEVDPAGTVFVEDTGNYVIDRIAPDGTVTIFAGTGEEWSDPRPGPATDTSVYVSSMSVSGDGTLYFVGHTQGVGRISPDGRLAILDVSTPGQPNSSPSYPSPIGISPERGLVAYYYSGSAEGEFRSYPLASLREYDPYAPPPPVKGFADLQVRHTSSLKAGQTFKVDVVVRTDGVASATGTVQVRLDGVVSKVKTLRAGAATLRAPVPWRRGKHKAVLIYSGDADTAARRYAMDVTMRRT